MRLLRLAIAVVVTVIWSLAYGKSILLDAPTPPAELSGIMLAVVTAVLHGEARQLLGRKRDDDGA